MDLDLLLNFNVCDEVTPVNVEDRAETALVKAIEETDVAGAGDPGLLFVEESSNYQGHVDHDHSLVIQFFCS